MYFRFRFVLGLLRSGLRDRRLRFLRDDLCLHRSLDLIGRGDIQRREFGDILAFDDIDQSPALGLGHRPALDDRYRVAELGCIVLIVGLEARPAADGFLISPMEAAPLHLDDARLVHLVADNSADPYFASFVAHCVARANSLSLIIV